jgi:hypothetical protein
MKIHPEEQISKDEPQFEDDMGEDELVQSAYFLIEALTFAPAAKPGTPEGQSKPSPNQRFRTDGSASDPACNRLTVRRNLA